MRPEYAKAHDDGDIHIHDLDFLCYRYLDLLSNGPLRCVFSKMVVLILATVTCVPQIVLVATVLFGYHSPS